MTSISTSNHEDKYIEILNNEKIALEKQLTDYKLRYAEANSKLIDIEEEILGLRKKNTVFNIIKIRIYVILYKQKINK